ncbi:MAG: prepilin-type N-terminal cleavage/methylation domain-containing protein, partial [Lachnospiraceae bacterium]|nr:prepilin-type N-terminal cleavage/methylation domain-containing protein [Lachnospiraceae bacterium]
MRGVTVAGKDKRQRNKGETIVEVMVAFMVLLIVLAIFGNSILAAGEAQKYAIDTRREADRGMIELQKIKYSGAGGQIRETKDAAVSGMRGSAVKAICYETTGGLTYWVFE